MMNPKSFRLILGFLLITMMPTLSKAENLIRYSASPYYDIYLPASEYALKNSVRLPSPAYRQTTSYTCGPAAVMALMYYYKMLKSSEMNQRTELRIANEMGTTKTGGTPPNNMVAWLEQHGFYVRSEEDINTDVLINNIRRRIPTLIAIEDHWTLATGYSVQKNSSKNDEIIFTDSSAGTIVMTRDRIDELRFDSVRKTYFSGNGVGYYIVAVPRGLR